MEPSFKPMCLSDAIALADKFDEYQKLNIQSPNQLEARQMLSKGGL